MRLKWQNRLWQSFNKEGLAGFKVDSEKDDDDASKAEQGKAGQGRAGTYNKVLTPGSLVAPLPPLLSPNVTLTPHCSTLTWLHLFYLCSSPHLLFVLAAIHLLISFSHLWQSDVRHKALHLVWHENNKKESVFWKKRRGLLKGRLVELGVSCWQLLKRIRATVQLSLGTSQPAIEWRRAKSWQLYPHWVFQNIAVFILLLVSGWPSSIVHRSCFFWWTTEHTVAR